MIIMGDTQAQSDNFRVLVVSGGGARGAWGGGVAETLTSENRHHYDVVIGTSAGSLLAPFIVTGDFNNLKRVYTDVNQRRIFNVNPFKTKGKKTGDIKGLQAVFRVLLGKRTLGETKRLRKYIYEELPSDLYEAVLDSGNFIVTTVNFSTGEIVYRSARLFDTRNMQPKIDSDKSDKWIQRDLRNRKDSLREAMLTWIWVSANQPVLMSLHATKDADGKKSYWVDGGVRENVPVIKGLKTILDSQGLEGIDTLDVIVNNSLKSGIEPMGKPKIIPSLLRSIDIFSYDVRKNDVNVPVDTSAQIHEKDLIQLNTPYHTIKDTPIPDNSILIRLYYMTDTTLQILPSSLLFVPDKMKNLWDAGKTTTLPPII